NLASESADPLIWKALEKATKRASVGLRMELLNYAACHHEEGLRSWFGFYPTAPLRDYDISDEQRKRLLTFLATFLADTTVRDPLPDPKKYSGPLPGLEYDPQLAVQDVAAVAMAQYLNLKLDFIRSREEWAKVREQVRKAWKRGQERESADKKAKSKKE